MTQITIAGIALPETSHDKYQCWEEKLSSQLDMISGRRVVEVRGDVWMCTYEYDYMGNSLMRQILAVLRGNSSFTATVLTDMGEEYTGTFLCESITNPTFAFTAHGDGLWHNFGFTLREVSPHD